MKVKHWAGYGTVEAQCVGRYPHVVIVDVIGNHEQGLTPRYFDNRDWLRWLGKRFRVNEAEVVEHNTWWEWSDNTDHMRVWFWR